MPEETRPATLLRVADLPQRKPHRFALSPEPELCAAIADALGLLGLRKLSFTGKVAATGQSDWRLEARLGATAIQPCVVTLAPVTTRIDTDVTRLFLRDWEEPSESEETEMPEEVNTDPLPAEIDLVAVMQEELALALPDYPRAEGAALETAQFAADGVTPMSDEAAKPFAGLAALKDKLEKPED